MPTLNSIASYFWRNVLENPARPALVDHLGGDPLSVTWSQIGQLVQDQLRRFDRQGLSGEQHIASSIPNSLAWIVLDLACQTRGMVHVGLDCRLPIALRNQLLEHSEAACHVGHDFLPPTVQCLTTRSLPEAAANGLALQSESVNTSAAAQLIYTSGTSAAPKGVLLSHMNLVSNAKAKLSAAPQSDEDLRLNLLPFSHAYARTCELSTWILTGGKLAIRTNWESFLQSGKTLEPTLVNLVPFLAEKLDSTLDQDVNALGGRLRLLQIGGAAVSTALFRRLQRHGLPPLQGYGLTEASPVVCTNIAGQQQPGTVGPAAKGIQIRLDDEGVLWTRGPNVMMGYWNAPQATADVLVDGWLCTGDLAHIHSDGRCTIVGRLSEQICLSNGLMVSPEEIERTFVADAWIAQAAVVGQGLPRPIGLVLPNVDEIPAEYFRTEKKTIESLDATRWTHAILQRLAGTQSSLLPYAIPKELCLLRRPFSTADGTATAKGTPRRRVLQQKYLANAASGSAKKHLETS